MNTRTVLNQRAVKELRAGRAKLKLTQKELAAISGYTPQMVADYEGSRATVPHALMIKVNELLKRHDASG